MIESAIIMFSYHVRRSSLVVVVTLAELALVWPNLHCFVSKLKSGGLHVGYLPSQRALPDLVSRARSSRDIKMEVPDGEVTN